MTDDWAIFQRMEQDKLNADKMTKEIIGKQPNTYTATKVRHSNI